MPASWWQATPSEDDTVTIAPITLHQPRRLAVGAGTIAEVGAWAADARSVLVIATPITTGFVDRLKLSGRVTVFDAIPGEPDARAALAMPAAALLNDPVALYGRAPDAKRPER